MGIGPTDAVASVPIALKQAQLQAHHELYTMMVALRAKMNPVEWFALETKNQDATKFNDASEKAMADAEKGIFPNDETLRTVIMHAASMVTIARSTGDLGRAQSAYKSFQDIVEHPSTPKAMNMMMDQLEKQIKSSVPQLKEYKTTTGSTQDANSPKGVSRETIKAAVEKAPRDGKRYEIKTKDGQVFYVKDGKVVP